MIKRILFIGVPLLVVGLAVGSRLNEVKKSGEELKKQAEGRKNRAAPVDLATVQERIFEDAIEGTATVESGLTTPIASRFNGQIISVAVQEGDRVMAGDLLVRIDPRELTGDRAAKASNVAQAQGRLAEAKVSASSNRTSIESTILQAKANVASGKANLNQVQKTAEARIASGKADVRVAQARVDTAKANITNAEKSLQASDVALKTARTRLDRLKKLLESGYVPQQQVDDQELVAENADRNREVSAGQLTTAQLALESSKAELGASESQLEIIKRQVESDLVAAQSRVELAEASLQAAIAARANIDAYDSNIQALEAGVNAARGELGQTESRLQDTEIRAPFSGAVTQRLLSPGAVAGPGQTILTLQSVDDLFVTLPVSAEEAARLTIGDDAVVQMESSAQAKRAKLRGKLVSINPSADLVTRKNLARIRVIDPAKTLSPGMFVKVRLSAGAKVRVIAVPTDAVEKAGEKTTVAVADEQGGIEVRPVSTGQTQNGFVEIVSGLSPGEKVVTLSYSKPKDGQRVSSSGVKKPEGQGGKP